MRDDLPHAMRETARRLEPDVGRLTEGGVERGTRMRRVERVVQVLGSVVAVAVVFAGVVLIESRHGSGDVVAHPGGRGRPANQTAEASRVGPTFPSATPTGGLAGSPTPTPTPATIPTVTVTDTPHVSVNELIGTLKAGLGGTGVTGSDYGAQGSDSAQGAKQPAVTGPSVHAQLSASHTVGFLSVVVNGPQNSVTPAGTPRSLGDGCTVYTAKETGSTDGHTPDLTILAVTLVRVDGSTLSAVETNARTPKGPAVLGAPLLLTEDQIVTLLDSPGWNAAVVTADALPPRTVSTALTPSAQTGSSGSSGID